MRDELMRIFSDYLEDVDFLNNEEKKIIMKLGIENEKCLPFFYDCYQSINSTKGRVEFNDMKLIFYYENKYHLIWDEEEIIFEEKHIRDLIAHYVDIFEEIYPMGTVVELSLDFSQKLKLKRVDQKVRVVIVERFASNNDKTAYYPYVGFVYPIGMAGCGKCIQFTGSLIDSVVHMGYRDNMEEAYVLLMKTELILKNDAISYGFYNDINGGEINAANRG